MKKFRIILKSGDYTEWNAENEEEVLKKISTGHYGILPVRARHMLYINPNTLDKVEEIID